MANEFIEFVHTGRTSLSGQEVVNRYHYWADLPAPPTLMDLKEMGEVFTLAVTNSVRNILSDTYSEEGLRVTSLTTGITWLYLDNAGELGTRGGPPDPAHLAWSVRLNSVTTAVRSGGKRYSPIPEADVVGTGQMSNITGIAGNMNILLINLAAVLPLPIAGYSIFPVIIHFPTVISPVMAFSTVGSAQLIQATTQRSRLAF